MGKEASVATMARRERGTGIYAICIVLAILGLALAYVAISSSQEPFLHGSSIVQPKILLDANGHQLCFSNGTAIGESGELINYNYTAFVWKNATGTYAVSG